MSRPHYIPQEGLMRARNEHGWLTLTDTNYWQAHWHEYVKDAATGKERRCHRSRLLGSKAKQRKFEAEEELSKIVAAVNARQGARPDPSVTFEWFLRERWLPLYQPRWNSLTTAKTNKQTIENQIIPALGSAKLSEVDAQRLSGFMGSLAAKGYGRYLIERCRYFVRSIMAEAVEEDFLTKNPARKLEMPRCEAPDDTYLPWDELVRLFEYLPTMPPRDYLLLMVELTTGLRPQELFGLHRRDLIACDLHLKRSVVHSRVQKQTKTGERDRRIVSLPQSLAEELRDYAKSLNGTDFMFPNADGGPLQKDNYRARIIKPIKEALGIKKLDFRVLRRTVGTWGLEHGSVKDVQWQLRHTKPDTLLKFYAKTIPASQREMVGRLYGSLVGAVDERRKQAEKDISGHRAKSASA